MTEERESYIVETVGVEEVRAVILVHQSGGTRYSDLVEALDATFGCGRDQAEMAVDVLAEIGRRRRAVEKAKQDYDVLSLGETAVPRGELAAARVSEGEAVRSLRATWHWLCGRSTE